MKTKTECETTAECLADFEVLSERWVKTSRLSSRARRLCLAVMKGEDLVPASEAAGGAKDPEELLTRVDAAREFKVSRKSLELWCHTGRLPFTRHAKVVLVRRRDLVDFFASTARTG